MDAQITKTTLNYLFSHNLNNLNLFYLFGWFDGVLGKYWNGNGWISNRLYNMDKCESMTQVSEPEEAWFGDGKPIKKDCTIF